MTDPLLLGGALTVVAGLTSALIALVRRRRANLERTARALGLDHDPVRRMAEGELEGRRVAAGESPIVHELVQRLKLHRFDSQGKPIFRVAARLDPELDLGLEVNHVLAMALRAAGEPEDEKLRHRYAMCGDERERVRALLNRGVRAQLVGVARAGARVWLCDAGVLIEPKRSTSTDALVVLIRRAVEIIHQIDGLREELPVAAHLSRALDDWRRLAEARSLDCLVNPLRLESPKLAAGATRIRHRVSQLWATARFVPPLDLELFGKSTPNVGLDVVSRQDVTTGDLDFDTVYELRASDEDELRALFGGELRRWLLELAASYDVSFDDSGITLRAPLGDVAVLAQMLDRVAAAADSIGRSRKHAPYR